MSKNKTKKQVGAELCQAQTNLIMFDLVLRLVGLYLIILETNFFLLEAVKNKEILEDNLKFSVWKTTSKFQAGR